MLLLLATLFIGLPIFEIWLLFEVGGELGAGWTVALCVVTGVVGAALSRVQGSQILRRITERTRRGEVPGKDLVDGLLVVVAGALLMTPGFVTDAVGFLLLFPLTRAMARQAVQAQLASRIRRVHPLSGAHFSGFGGVGRRPPSRPTRSVQPEVELLPPGSVATPRRRSPPDIIDVDFE